MKPYLKRASLEFSNIYRIGNPGRVSGQLWHMQTLPSDDMSLGQAGPIALACLFDAKILQVF